MKKFTIYYINKNGDRIAVYNFNSYTLATKAYEAAIALDDLSEECGECVNWHMIDNEHETVLF